MKQIQGMSDEQSRANIARTIYREFGYKVRIEDAEDTQDEKPLHVQAAEILGHIHNRDYGLAESKAGLLRDQLQKGDWTLGAGTETNLSDDGFVRLRCDVINRSGEGADDRATLLKILEIVKRLNDSDARKDIRAIKSMKLVDRIITEWSTQRDEDTTSIKERTCAFCGRADPCVICGGDWFCDMKCANDNAGKFEIAAISDVNHIKYLEQVIEDRDKTMGLMAKRHANRKVHIHNIWSVVGQKDATIKQQSNTIEDLKQRHGEKDVVIIQKNLGLIGMDTKIKERDATIEDLDLQLTEKQVIIDKITLLRVNEVETRQNLEAELADKSKDSDVLMQVVEIVRPWDDEDAGIYPNLYQLNSLHECLVDYIDAPETGARQ